MKMESFQACSDDFKIISFQKDNIGTHAEGPQNDKLSGLSQERVLNNPNPLDLAQQEKVDPASCSIEEDLTWLQHS